MNWVGGSRNRLVTKSDAKKQREFFEKRKMQKKWKNLGMPPSPCPGGADSANMDLVTLFIVNQIAAKKESKDPPKVAVLGSGQRGPGQRGPGQRGPGQRGPGQRGPGQRGPGQRGQPLVLPMSPCSPSRLSLVEGQPQYGVDGSRRSMNVIPQRFKFRQLSPVPESAFSDNSASDYLPHMADPFSPFSSTSPGQGIFPPRVNFQPRGQMQTWLHPHRSPLPWDTPGLEQRQFQPFSRARSMMDNRLWSCGSNAGFFQPDRPTAAHVLFGSPEPDEPGVGFSLNQSEAKEPGMDFILNPLELQLDEDVFRGFSNDDYDREAPHFGIERAKIYFNDGMPVASSAPQTVPDPRCTGMQDDWQLGLQAPASSHVDWVRCADTPQQDSQGTPRPLPLLTRHPAHFTGDQEMTGSVACPYKPSGSDCQGGSSAVRFESPRAAVRSPAPRGCKETRDAGTQTADAPAAETRDASTQCGAYETSVFNLVLPPAFASVQHPATRGQADTGNARSAPAGGAGSGGRHTPRSRKRPQADSPPGSSLTDATPANSSGDDGAFP